MPTAQEILKISGRFLSLDSAIGKIEPGQTIHFVTAGAWSLHDLLAYVLRQTGPADVDCFTFSWGPDATRTALELLRNGRIRKLRIALHDLMKKWTVTAMQIMQNHAEKIALLPLHAKGFLVSNDDWKLSVISSANFSLNHSIEAGVITTDAAVFGMHKIWLDKVFDKGSEFVGDSYREPTVETPPADVNGRRLIIVRGLPGSGKSTFAGIVADETFSNDDYYHDWKDQVGADFLRFAKADCYKHVKDAMERDVKTIAVANTFIKPDSFENYLELARQYGYSAFCVVVENRHGGVSVHDVPPEWIDKQRQKFKIQL